MLEPAAAMSFDASAMVTGLLGAGVEEILVDSRGVEHGNI